MVDINTQIDFEKIISKKGFLDFEIDPSLDLFAEIEKLKKEKFAQWNSDIEKLNAFYNEQIVLTKK